MRCSANIVDSLGGVPFIFGGVEVEPYLELPYKKLTVMRQENGSFRGWFKDAIQHQYKFVTCSDTNTTKRVVGEAEWREQGVYGKSPFRKSVP